MNIINIKKWCFCLLISMYMGSGIYAAAPVSKKDPFKGKTDALSIQKALKELKVDELAKAKADKKLSYRNMGMMCILKQIAIAKYEGTLEATVSGNDKVRDSLITLPGENGRYVSAWGLLHFCRLITTDDLQNDEERRSVVMNLNQGIIQTLAYLDLTKMGAFQRNLPRRLGKYYDFIGIKDGDFEGKVTLMNQSPDQWTCYVVDKPICLRNTQAVEGIISMANDVIEDNASAEIEYNVYHLAAGSILAFIFGLFTGAVHNEVNRERERVDRLREEKKKKKKASAKKELEDDDESDDDDEIFTKKKNRKGKKK